MMRDDQGNVVITGVFGMAFVLGLTLYQVGLGDAMIQHETMRDASDAAALAPAVMQARGMNVLAFVNLVMVAIVAVLAAVKVVQLLLMAANLIACALPMNPICPMLSSWQSPFGKFSKVTEQTIGHINKGLYASETALAKTMPVLGQAKSMMAATKYGSASIERGFYVSLSLVPGELDSSAGSLIAGGGGLGGNSSGVRWGLPVEDEPYADLCAQASDKINDLVFRPLKFLPGANVIIQPVTKLAGHLISQLTKAFPGYFCGGGGAFGSFSSLASGAFKDIAKELAKKGIEKVAGEICKAATGVMPTPSPTFAPGMVSFNASSCAAGMTSSLRSISSPNAIDGSKQTTKRIYRPATMGSDYYASWGFAIAAKSGMRDDIDPQLEVTSMGRAGAGAGVRVLSVDQLDRMLGAMQFSKSEMFYEREGDWGTLREEALLNPRWRARLRRYRPPTEGAAGLMTRGGGGSWVERSMSVKGGAISFASVALGNPETLAAWLDRHSGAKTPSRKTGGVFH